MEEKIQSVLESEKSKICHLGCYTIGYESDTMNTWLYRNVCDGHDSWDQGSKW